MKKVSVRFLCIALVVAVLVSSIGTAVALCFLSPLGVTAILGRHGWYQKIAAIERLTDANYLWPLDEDALADTLSRSYIEGLGDPYAGYFGVEDTETNRLANQGDIIALGITVLAHQELAGLYIYRCDPNSPAYAAGVRDGDVIVALNGTLLTDMEENEAFTLLSGLQEQNSVTLTLQREQETVNCTVSPAEYEQTTVYYRMVEDCGYVQFVRFNELTPKQLQTALAAFEEAGATSLIFDLRQCGGGVIEGTAEALQQLLPACNIITAAYANGKQQVLYTCDGSQETDWPIVVLTDSRTASSAELFAAAIRDTGKGVLLGTTTYGKGVMQRTYNLPDGSSVKFTVAEFFPPSGESFHGVGLTPDFPLALTQEETDNYYYLTDATDRQLQAAVAYLQTGEIPQS